MTPPRALAWLGAGPRAAARLANRTPLRIKLVAALLALSAIGLTVAGATAVVALRGYLLDRIDKQLEDTARRPDLREGELPGSGERPPPGPGAPPPPPRPGGPASSTAFFVQVADSSGDGEYQLEQPGSRPGAENTTATDADQTRPQLPTLTIEKARQLDDQPFTVPAQGAGSDWRVLVRVLPDDSRSIAVAVTLNDVNDAVSRLALIELGVGLAVLAILAALGYVAVRSSLRRLMEVEVTAEAIAGGDLSRRVPEGDDRTEVGRLSRALNTMLTQIESAFRARESSEASARASEQRMRRFVADASHELRTPLTSIRGFAELHRQGAVPGELGVERVMRRIEAEATRMGLLVEDLLLLARLDQQRPIERHPVDLLAIATDAVGDARVVAPDHPVRLEIIGGPEAAPPVVIGDEARLRQVVGNLVSNALTHTPAGTTVTVQLGTGGDTAQLTVVDDGPGMAPEHAERVFERFYRADSARTRTSGGSGLGLSIVAALVAAHGGTVEVCTSAGVGTRFDLSLPLFRQESAKDPRAYSQLPGRVEPGRRRDREK